MSRHDERGAGRRDADPLAPLAPGWSLPAPSGSPSSSLPPGLLVGALRNLAAADSRADVASVALPLLLEVRGVRACAVVGRDGAQALVLGSAGYDCGTMAAGAALPLDAGLPVTEAVRTGRRVCRGDGPSWVALPFGGTRPDGALLLSLTAAPPGLDELEQLAALSSAIGDALRRARAQERAFLDLALVTASLAPPRAADSPGALVRSLPLDGVVGGDVAVRLPDGRGGTWLVLADVGRGGLDAAVTARTVHTAVTALAEHHRDPARLLTAVGAVLSVGGARPEVRAIAVRLTSTGRASELAYASAGGPLPVVVEAGRSSVLPGTPGPPLGAGVPSTSVVPVPAEAVVLLHSDGLLRGQSAVALLSGAAGTDLHVLADHVLRAAAAAGPPVDDVTLLLVRAR